MAWCEICVQLTFDMFAAWRKQEITCLFPNEKMKHYLYTTAVFVLLVSPDEVSFLLSVQRVKDSEWAAAASEYQSGLRGGQAAEAAGAGPESAGWRRSADITAGGAGEDERGAARGVGPEEEAGGRAQHGETGAPTGENRRDTRSLVYGPFIRQTGCLNLRKQTENVCVSKHLSHFKVTLGWWPVTLKHNIYPEGLQRPRCVSNSLCIRSFDSYKMTCQRSL